MTITLREAFLIMDAIAFTLAGEDGCDDIIPRTQTMFMKFCEDQGIDKIKKTKVTLK